MALTLFSLEGKNILVTGASSGIGRQCAIICSEMGANIILVGRDMERLKQTEELLAKGNHLCYSVDITKYSSVLSFVEQTVTTIGKIAGFIHSAGVELTLPFKNTHPDNYEKTFAVNVIAGFEIAKILSNKKYCDETGASFVFIASVMGIVGGVGKVAYCSSKGALIAGAKSMALELASKKIRVNCISPAMVETDMAYELFNSIGEEAKNEIIKLHPLGMGEPMDVAAGCVYLLSKSAKWVTGSNLIIDGGYSAK